MPSLIASRFRRSGFLLAACEKHAFEGIAREGGPGVWGILVPAAVTVVAIFALIWMARG
jgi:hypothetical protein